MKLIDNILVTLSSRIILLLLALVSSIILARFLGPEGRGLFALILLLPEWARTFGLLGFEQANAVYAGLESEHRQALVWQSLIIACVVGGAAAVACTTWLVRGAPGFAALLRGPVWPYLLLVSTIPFRLVIEYWGAILRGMNRIVLLNMVDVGTKVTSLTLVVILVVWLRFNVAGAVWADFLLTVASFLLMVALLRYVGVWGKPRFDRPLWARTTRFALPAHGGTIAAYSNYRIDELFVAAMLQPAQLGFYVIAVSLVERFWIVPGAVATALLPHLANQKERDPKLSAVIARHVVVWVGAACLLAFVLADVIVRILYSTKFAEVAAPLRWLLPGILSLSVGKVLVSELLVREKPHYSIYAAGCAAIVNVVCNLILIPYMGISGAALASSISYTLQSFMAIFYYLRETELPWTILIPRWSDIPVYAEFWRCRFRSSHSATP